jgi:hypothetical protein
MQLVIAGELEEVPVPVGMAQPAFDRHRVVRAPSIPVDEALEAQAIIRVDDLEDAAADQCLGRVTQHPLDSLADIADGAVPVQQPDDVGGLLDKRPEAQLVNPGPSPQRLCRAHAGRDVPRLDLQSLRGGKSVDLDPRAQWRMASLERDRATVRQGQPILLLEDRPDGLGKAVPESLS